MLHGYFKGHATMTELNSNMQNLGNAIKGDTQPNNDMKPVGIIGGGPVGLTFAALLAKFRVPSVVIEAKSTLSDHPQAHFIGARSMEIFRNIDRGLADDIINSTPPKSDWAHFAYTTAALDEPFAASNHFDTLAARDYARFTPTPPAHLAQTWLLPKLRRLLGEKAPFKDFVTILDGHRADPRSLALDSSVDNGPVRVKSSNNGVQNVQGHEFSFLLAADGATSTFREHWGERQQGKFRLQRLLNIHFRSSLLADALRQSLNSKVMASPAMLYFVYNPQIIAVLVNHSLDEGEFALQVPYFPPMEDPDSDDFEFHKQQVLKAVMPLDHQRGTYQDTDSIKRSIKIQSVKKWSMNASMLPNMVHESNRLAFAGDAAHQYPPSGGFGMNTGLGDAHALAWRLAREVHSGGRSEKSWAVSLREWNDERIHVIRSNLAQSMKNYNAVVKTSTLLGLDPRLASTVDGMINWTAGRLMPTSLAQSLHSTVLSMGRHQMDSAVMKSVIGHSRVRAVQQQIARGESLQLFFAGQDLDYSYKQQYGTERMAFESAFVVKTDYGDPCSLPGRRMPHLWLTNQTNGSRLSTLDLIGEDTEDTMFVLPAPGAIIPDTTTHSGPCYVIHPDSTDYRPDSEVYNAMVRTLDPQEALILRVRPDGTVFDFDIAS